MSSGASSRVTKCEPKLRTSASSQQTMSPSHAYSDSHSALPLPEPVGQLGEDLVDRRARGRPPSWRPRRWRRSTRRRSRRPRRRAVRARPGCGGPWRRSGRPSPPRCAPAGTPRSRCRCAAWPSTSASTSSPAHLPCCSSVVQATDVVHAGIVPRRRGGARATVFAERVHPERSRDRPYDTAATSITLGHRGERVPGANA